MNILDSSHPYRRHTVGSERKWVKERRNESDRAGESEIANIECVCVCVCEDKRVGRVNERE